jgi:hypothetical protein
VRRLAQVLALDYRHLMQLADYLDGDEGAEASRRRPRPRPHPLADQGLTAEKWRAVGAFVKTLKAQRPKA